jgi:WD40 repeat protein
VLTVAFAPDGQYFATAGGDWDTTVQLYKGNGEHIARLPQDECRRREDHWNCGTLDIAFSPDGQGFLTASDTGTIRMYDLKGELLQTLTQHKARVNSLVFAPDGQSFLSASNDRTVILWAKDGSVKQVLKGHTDGVTQAVFSPDGNYIVTASQDKTARLWNRVVPQ